VVAPSTGSVVLVPFPFSDLSQAARGHRWPDAGHASCLVVDPTVTGTAEAARKCCSYTEAIALDCGSALYIVLNKLCLPFR
jgi:hypothetical protein